ncbi:hypothetical protein COV93_05865 [Candidatus Woesearchaeota archaeon CG11_big_fil_rev_8_21_14_0_20_43_8]|nr:MAG: hypothetical protein COV93_05865 [Candidatus Woesearchaeota archaeon CG11_big_fil_rev_8_21_14_0_20_43_8]PIO05294.1 MAG: hypothetical protein COT47_05445 [Candidatus Woesearchaeota archaeon CG08_land_8_20_14_0_20_43_7]
MKISKLEKILKRAWCRETSADPDNWTEKVPEYGQCAVTACVVQDYMGGEIVWANAKHPNGQEISHYFNVVDDEEVDLTRSQFPEGTLIPLGVPKRKQFPTTRDYVLSYGPSLDRYKILKHRVELELDK